MTSLRDLAPQVLGVLVRRYGDFAGAEDAVQEALIAAAESWPDKGEPDDPFAWLVRVASRRMANHFRAEAARNRREEMVTAMAHAETETAPSDDDTLLLMFMSSHPSLTPGAAIPLTLRAVGGLTTAEIAAAFLVPEATMAQRITRAKAKLRGKRMGPRGADSLRSVLRVLYLMFNEGYEAASGPDLTRPDLAREAIRLTRMLLASIPDEGEVESLLALMLLSEARRPARTSVDGSLVPLAEQDRTRWDRDLIREGLTHVTSALQRGPLGEYGLQAAINGLHSEAPSSAATRWADVATLYQRLELVTGNPVVRLNRAVAVAMAEGPDAGLALLADLDGPLGEHHRLLSVRAHLHERAGERELAIDGFRRAAARTANARERNYLLIQAARLGSSPKM